MKPAAWDSPEYREFAASVLPPQPLDLTTTWGHYLMFRHASAIMTPDYIQIADAAPGFPWAAVWFWLAVYLWTWGTVVIVIALRFNADYRASWRILLWPVMWLTPGWWRGFGR